MVSSARLAIARALRRTNPITIKLKNASLKIRPFSPDFSVARSCLIMNEFSSVGEMENVQFIIDGGGYIGTAAIAFAKMFPTARIITVEPSQENFEILQENVRQFLNIIPLQAALTSSDCVLTLYDRGTGPWGFTTSTRQDGQALTAIQRCSGVSIPTLMKTYGVARIDILKLDVEGAEREIIANSENWLRSVRAIFRAT